VTFLKFIIPWIIVGISLYGLYWFFGPRSGEKSKRIKLPIFLGGGEYQVEYQSTESTESTAKRPEPSAPPKIQDKEGDLVNVALNKPVIYLGNLIPIPLERYYYERYSVNTGNYARNLTDGNPETRAYPGHWAFDYVIDLQDVYDIKKVKLVWGSFGMRDKHTYITSWKLLYQENVTGNKELSSDDWNIVGEGDFPDTTVTTLEQPISARRFRIIAMSVKIEGRKLKLLNWIGMHEFKAYAST